MSFDPYHKWLGIPPAEQPPNHYRLLGIALCETDPEVIDAAANRQMAYLHQCAVGPHAEDSQRLLNAVAAVRVCLLKPETKAAYDAELRRTFARRARFKLLRWGAVLIPLIVLLFVAAWQLQRSERVPAAASKNPPDLAQAALDETPSEQAQQTQSSSSVEGNAAPHETAPAPDKQSIAAQPSNLKLIPGIVALIYGGADFQKQKAVRIDAQIFQNFGEGSPGPNIERDHFSIRWLGYIRPPVAGEYTIVVYADDSIKLWIDGTLLVSYWNNGAARERCTKVNWTEGPHKLRVDFNDYRSTADINLAWYAPGSIKRVPIPPECFFHDAEQAEPLREKSPRVLELLDQHKAANSRQATAVAGLEHTGPFADLAGFWAVTCRNGSGKYYAIDDAGHVTELRPAAERQAQLSREGTQTLLKFEDGSLESISVKDAVLYIEQFKLAKDYPKKIALRGVGVRIDQRD